MAPKKRKGKNRKTKKEQPPKPTKSQYLAKIAEMNSVLAQARKEGFQLEGTYHETDKSYEQLQEDLADVAKYLNHEIEDCEEESAEYQLGIDKHTEEMANREKYYETIFTQMDNEYEAKRSQLSERLESVNAKLNAMEEVKRQRDEFVRKQTALQRIMEEMEQRHKLEIYEAEKQAIIGQDKLQKELESRLGRLASDFKEATQIRIGETTNVIIGENIKLGNMLTSKQEFLTKAEAEYQEMKKTYRSIALDLQLKKEECSMIFVKYSENAERIVELLDSVEIMNKRIEEFKKLIKINRKMRRKITELECLIQELAEEQAVLSKFLEEITKIISAAKENLRDYQRNIIKQQICMLDAAKKVKEAMECENIVVRAPENKNGDEMEPGTDGEKSSHSEKDKKEYQYLKRESLIKEIVLNFNVEILKLDEFHITVPLKGSNDVIFSRRSSIGENSPT